MHGHASIPLDKQAISKDMNQLANPSQQDGDIRDAGLSVREQVQARKRRDKVNDKTDDEDDGKNKKLAVE